MPRIEQRISLSISSKNITCKSNSWLILVCVCVHSVCTWGFFGRGGDIFYIIYRSDYHMDHHLCFTWLRTILMCIHAKLERVWIPASINIAACHCEDLIINASTREYHICTFQCTGVVVNVTVCRRYSTATIYCMCINTMT
jgi:hypothetical protein